MNLDKLKDMPSFKEAGDYDKLNMRDAFQLGQHDGVVSFVKWLDENYKRTKRGWYHQGDFFKNGKPIKTEELIKIFFSNQIDP